MMHASSMLAGGVFLFLSAAGACLAMTSDMQATLTAGGCGVLVLAKAGESCDFFRVQAKLDAETFAELNKALPCSSASHRLSAGELVCTGDQLHFCEGRTVPVRAGSTCTQVHDAHGMSRVQFLRLNPHLPLNTCGSLASQEVCVAARMQGPCNGLNHTVLPGESWESVAAAKQTTYATLRALNPGVTEADAKPRAGDSICLGCPPGLLCGVKIDTALSELLNGSPQVCQMVADCVVRAELQDNSPFSPALLLWKTNATGMQQPGLIRLLPRQFKDGSGIIEHYAVADGAAASGAAVLSGPNRRALHRATPRSPSIDKINNETVVFNGSNQSISNKSMYPTATVRAQPLSWY